MVAMLKADDGFAPVQKSFDQAIADLRAGKVDARRLEDVKSNQKYALLNSFDNPDAVARQLVGAIGPTGDPRALDALFNHMGRLAPKDLVAFARTHLVPTNETRISLTGTGAKAPAGFPEYRPSPHKPAQRSPAAAKEGGAP